MNQWSKSGVASAGTARRAQEIFHVETRVNLHRVAAHVLGRRRHAVTGRFGLRSTPAGFGTPAFGDPLEVVRISRTNLVHEQGASLRTAPVAGSSLRDLASFVGTDVESEFSVGHDTPALDDPDDPIRLDARTVELLATWFALAWAALDAYAAGLGPGADPAAIQLWPEHLDAATTVTLAKDRRVNIGFSAGDGFESEPYAYFGPWARERPGDRSYWNAPFGAALGSAEILGAPSPLERAVGFLREGERNLGAG